jgi:WXG100 family type VII secretion target
LSVTRIRSDHSTLNQIARQFSQQAEATAQATRLLQSRMDVLQSGHWVGSSADKFYAEMNGAVLPSLQRLSKSLESAAQTTTKISQIMKQTESDAAAIFKFDAHAKEKPLGAGIGAVVGGVIGTVVAGPLGGLAGAALGGIIGNSVTNSSGGSGGSATGTGGSASAGGTGTVDSVFTGASKQADAPSKITLPKTLDDGMQSAWKDSFPGGHEQEQGGVLFKANDGTLKWVRGPGDNGGSWTPNWGDVKGDLLGTGHTHPYDSGHVNVPFSDGDIEGFFQSDLKGSTMEKMMTVQSGDGQFVLARTDEFNKLVSGKSDAEIATLKTDMAKTYNDAVTASKASGAAFPDRYDAAVKAVAQKYHLLYYKGKNGSLDLQ